MLVDCNETIAKVLIQFGLAVEPAKPAPVEEPKPIPTVPPAPKPDPIKMPTIDITNYDSPNCSTRAASINAIICHNTAGKFMPSVEWLCNPDAQVSAHLVIARDGRTACLVDFPKKAWHAGSAEWNNCSIGIEIEAYDGATGLTAKQEEVLVRWIKWLMQRYGIKSDRVKTHRSVCPDTDCPILIWPKEADFLTWRKEKIG